MTDYNINFGENSIDIDDFFYTQTDSKADHDGGYNKKPSDDIGSWSTISVASPIPNSSLEKRSHHDTIHLPVLASKEGDWDAIVQTITEEYPQACPNGRFILLHLEFEGLIKKDSCSIFDDIAQWFARNEKEVFSTQQVKKGLCNIQKIAIYATGDSERCHYHILLRWNEPIKMSDPVRKKVILHFGNFLTSCRYKHINAYVNLCCRNKLEALRTGILSLSVFSRQSIALFEDIPKLAMVKDSPMLEREQDFLPPSPKPSMLQPSTALTAGQLTETNKFFDSQLFSETQVFDKMLSLGKISLSEMKTLFPDAWERGRQYYQQLSKYLIN